MTWIRVIPFDADETLRRAREARDQLMGRLWRSKLVEEMLAQVDSGAARPAGLAPEFGLKKGGYRLSEVQAQRILEMQLQRLTGLEQDKIVSEYKEVMEKIVDLLDILAKPARITQIISGELADKNPHEAVSIIRNWLHEDAA